MAGILVRQIVGFKHHDGKSELQYGVRSDGGGGEAAGLFWWPSVVTGWVSSFPDQTGK